MKHPKHPILRTAVHNDNTGGYSPVSDKYHANLHERINYRGAGSPYHIINNSPRRDRILTREQRQDRYEVSCLERGIRPYGYPDGLWEQHLRDVADEEHTERCEAKNAWRYEN